VTRSFSCFFFLLVAIASAPARYGRRSQSNTKSTSSRCPIMVPFPKYRKNFRKKKIQNSFHSRRLKYTCFPIYREQNYFLLPYKKISHNRFPYFSLYQLNIIFLLLFYSFSLFPTFSLFPISINYTSFILK